MNTNLDDLITLIQSEPDADKHIHMDDDCWYITNEWLCGAFAGRAFSAKTPYGAARQLADYLDEHIGHKSMVGRSVTESGWPDLAMVRVYLARQREDDNDAQAE